MMNFTRCEVPTRLRGYGENQKLITAFVESGYECAKVTNFKGDIKSLPSRLMRCAKKLGFPHIIATRVDDNVYIVNTILLNKEDSADGT